MRKLTAGLAFAVFMSCILYGCSYSITGTSDGSQGKDIAAQNGSGAAADDKPAKGGVLRLFSTEPDTLNPILTHNTYVHDFCELIYEPLVRLDKDQKPLPCLAEKWDVSPDGLIWTFHIRKDVVWHDKWPLTSEDVEYTVKAILSSENDTVYKKNLQNVTTFAAIDRSTFRLILKSPYSFFAERMTFPILPEHRFSGDNMSKALYNMKPVGTGPYRFVSYSKGGMIRLAANDAWWKSELPVSKNPAPPYISEVDIRIYENPTDAANAFQSKDADVILSESNSAGRYSNRSDISIKEYTGNEYVFAAMNLKRRIFSDVAVRKAISAAIDRSKLIDDAVPGQAVEAGIPLIPGCWLDNSGGDSVRADTRSAGEMLEKAGYKESDGVMVKYAGGVQVKLDFELLVNSDDSARLNIAQNIAEQLGSIGIRARIRKAGMEEERNIIGSRDFDMAVLGCRTGSAPDISYMYSSSPSEGILNVSGYSSSVVDECLDKIAKTTDETEKKKLFAGMKKQILDDMPYIGLFFYRNAMMCSNRVKGLIDPYIWYRFNDAAQWYIGPE